MNLTNHFKKRYCKRILNIDESEISNYVKQHHDVITTASQELFESATFLWNGSFNNNQPANFYINGMTVLVVDEDNNTLITLWNSDFGFKDSINKNIVKEIVTDIEKLQLKHKRCTEKASKQSLKLELEAETITRQMQLLQNQLGLLDGKLQNHYRRMELLHNDPHIIQEEIGVLAVRLCNSLEYKMDLMNLGK